MGLGVKAQVSLPEGGAGGEQAGVEGRRLAKYRKHAGFGLAGLAGEIQVVAAAEDEQIFVGPSQAGWCVAVGQLAVGGADVGEAHAVVPAAGDAHEGQAQVGEALAEARRSIGLAEGLTAQSGALPGAEELTQSGQLANFSFGQGSLLAAPMQVAALFNTLAADGVYRAPYVLQATLDETTGQPVETLSHPRGRRVIPTQSAALLRAMLVQVVQQGTAQDAAGLSGGAGGKTGTAQTGQFTAEGKERKNLWFAGFYPAEDPQYTIVVLQDGQTQAAVSSAAVFAQLCTALHWLG